MDGWHEVFECFIDRVTTIIGSWSGLHSVVVFLSARCIGALVSYEVFGWSARLRHASVGSSGLAAVDQLLDAR